VIFRRALVLLLLIAAAAAAYAAWAILGPAGGFSGEQFVQVPRGAGSFEVAARLRSSGVLASEWPFLLIRLLRPRSVLQAGEYRFDRPLSPVEIYQKIARGEVSYYSLTIPEGFTISEIAGAVADTRILTRQEFLLAAGRGDRIADLAPGARSLEGFLYPDTYRITRGTTADELVEGMLRRFREVYGALPPAEASVLETVTLASLVEEETAVAAERPLVASVFGNRLRAGMPLQCDPTVIYALQLEGRYRGALYQEDLGVRSPYNTYLRPGLPPGPISSPGRASLQAVLAPAHTNYLYFVADNQGGHVFSADLDRHSRAAASYRRAADRAAPQRKKPNRGR